VTDEQSIERALEVLPDYQKLWNSVAVSSSRSSSSSGGGSSSSISSSSSGVEGQAAVVLVLRTTKSYGDVIQ